MGAYGSPELHPNFKGNSNYNPQDAFIYCPKCGTHYSRKMQACPSCGEYNKHSGQKLIEPTSIIPGFRHRVIWRMVLSVLYYLVAIFTVFSASTYPIYAKLMQLFLLFGVAYFISLIPKPPFGMKRWFYAIIGAIMICIGLAGNHIIHYLPGGLVRGNWFSDKPYAFTVDIMTKNLDNYVPGLYTFTVTGTPGKKPMYNIYISQEPKKSITQDDVPVFTMGGMHEPIKCEYILNSGDYVYVVPYPVIYKTSGQLYINRVD